MLIAVNPYIAPTECWTPFYIVYIQISLFNPHNIPKEVVVVFIPILQGKWFASGYTVN